MTTLTSTVSASSSNYGYLTAVQVPVSIREHPAAPLPTRHTRQHVCDVCDHITILAPLVRRTASVSNGFSVAPLHRSVGDDYLCYYYLHSYITCEIDDCNGIATDWFVAKNHFYDSNCNGNELYFITERLTNRSFLARKVVQSTLLTIRETFNAAIILTFAVIQGRYYPYQS